MDWTRGEKGVGFKSPTSVVAIVSAGTERSFPTIKRLVIVSIVIILGFSSSGRICTGPLHQLITN